MSRTGDNINYPGLFASVIAVAATVSADARGYFSSTGPDVEMAAPGVAIKSTVPGGGYATWSGTSMASPHVAGTAALVKTAYPSSTDSQIRARLQQTADNLGDTGKDTLYGYGIVDADGAVGAPDNQPPPANAGGPYGGTEDSPVNFDGSKSSDPDGDSLTYSWTFGDGSTGTGVNPSHTYTAEGSYTVTVVVNDGKVDSALATTTATVTEVNDPPIANAGPDQNAVVGPQIAFDSSASPDVDGSIVSYEWSFADGGKASGVTASHSYATPRTYSVTLKSTDDGGAAATDSAVVTVTDAPGNLMHMASITLSSKKASQNTGATATVTMFDGKGLPVPGATAYGHWSEATRDQDYGITGPEGHVTLQSDYVKKVARGTSLTFTVDDVMLAGKTYGPTANAETSHSTAIS